MQENKEIYSEEDLTSLAPDMNSAEQTKIVSDRSSQIEVTWTHHIMGTFQVKVNNCSCQKRENMKREEKRLKK